MAPPGSQKLAILLCKFKDNDTEPFNTAFFEDFFVNRGTQGINDYYITASYGAINFDGSTVFDWASTSMDRETFLSKAPSRWDKVNVACDTHSITRSDYWGVVAIFNDNTNDDGNDGARGVLAWTGDLDMQHRFFAHELGHAFGVNDSYDESDRLVADDHTYGWYCDNYDIMSARNVISFDHPRWSWTGPLMCAANQDWIGWLPEDRVWSPAAGSNEVETIDLVALGHYADVKGPVCVKVDKWYIEFRTRDGFDAGLDHPCVLIHWNTPTANATLHNYSHTGSNWDNEWLPGRTFSTSDPALFALTGGTSVEVVSFNPAAYTARLRIRHVTARPPAGGFQGPGRVFGGVTVDGGGWIILPGGHVVPIPPRSPVMGLVERVAIAAQVEAMMGGRAKETIARPMYTEIERMAASAAKGGFDEVRERRC